MTQKNFILNLCRKNPEAIIIASLGTICYDLKEIDHKNKILITGAMGCTMGVALGYALSSKKKVICVIGDGSYQMKQGSQNTILSYKPKNLKVYIMVNGTYASTGGQSINPIAHSIKSHFHEILCK